jgi:hypothetical protein
MRSKFGPLSGPTHGNGLRSHGQKNPRVKTKLEVLKGGCPTTDHLLRVQAIVPKNSRFSLARAHLKFFFACACASIKNFA